MSYLCLARDIQEGEYRVFDLFDEHVIAKKEKGKITVAKNTCRHRHFKVADCDGKGPLKCQYHGLRFNYEQVYRHHEFGEFVFLPTFLGSTQVLDKVGEHIGEEFGACTMQVEAPFYIWMQNTADPNHLTTTHKKSFAKLFDGNKPENIYVSEFESSFNMRIKDEVIERYAKYSGDEKLLNDGWFHYLAFPNLSVTSFCGIFYSIETAKPTSTGCEVHTRFFVGKDAKVPKLLKTMALDGNIKILQEDKELVEKWAKTYKFTETEAWMQGEERIKRYADEIKARGLG